jgi:two-component system, OmpR family, sensor histidine kinase BaeS
MRPSGTAIFFHNSLVACVYTGYHKIMRLRLFHQLFLLIAGSALLAAIAMAVVLSFNLRSSFSYYLQEQDREQLDGFVLAAGANISARGQSAFQRDGRLDIKTLIADMIRRRDIPNAPTGSGRDGMEADRDPLPASLLPPGSLPRRSGRPPDGFALRLLIYDAAGHQVIGPPPLPPRPPGRDTSKMLERSIKAGGKIVAVAKLLPRSRTEQCRCQIPAKPISQRRAHCLAVAHTCNHTRACACANWYTAACRNAEGGQ